MIIHLIPRRTTDLETTTEPLDTRVHDGPDCPFADDGFPHGLASCCVLWATNAANNLNALGMSRLFVQMAQSQDAEQAVQYARELHSATSELERRYWNRRRRPKGARPERSRGLPRCSFEDALASIRQAADWYEKVGRLGFGVTARY